MRVVAVGDPHLDAVTMGTARFEEVVAALNDTVDHAVQQRADLWVCVGDVFDPDAGPVVYRAVELLLRVAWRLRLAGVPQLWVAGNHDVVEDGTGTTTLSPLRAMAAQEVGGSPVLLAERPACWLLPGRLGGRPVAALPYTATSHAYDPGSFLRETVNERAGALVFGHLVVPGVSAGEEAVEFARGRDVFFPVEDAAARASVMVNGHHHRRGRSPGGVLIPGSLARLTAGEREHEPGFLVVESGGG